MKIAIIKVWIIVFMISIFSINSFGNDKSKLPKALNSSAIGTEFYFSFIPAWENGDYNVCKIYVTSNRRTKVTVEVADKGYSEEKYTIPNSIIEFELSPDVALTTRKKQNQKPKAERKYKGAGIHIIAEDSVICYGATRFGFTSDAFLILPTTLLGTRYIVSSFADATNNLVQWLPSYTSITATQDETEVNFTMGGTDWSQTAGELNPGQEKGWIMDAGDVVLIASSGERAELSGSIIESDKPVAVVSGNYCAFVPVDCGPCDLLEEMELPTDTWGYHYHVPNIIGRQKNSMLNIFAGEANTNISRDNKLIGFLKKSGGTSGTGYFNIRADEGSARPIVISGNKPIGVTLFNTSYQDDNVSSDPFQMNLIPVEHYANEGFFITPDTIFNKNYLAICYQPNSWGQIPDDMMIGTIVSGETVWQKLIEFSPEEGEPFAKVDEVAYNLKTIELDKNRVYRLKAENKFQCYSYGFTDFESYGMPSFFGETQFGEPNKDMLAPTIDYEIDCAGKVTGTIRDNADGNVAKSCIKTIYLVQEESKNYKLSYNNFVPCEDSIINFELKRIFRREDAKAIIFVEDCAGNSSTFTIEHIDSNKIFTSYYMELIDFGYVPYGQKPIKSFYVFNKSDKFDAKIEKIEFKSTLSRIGSKVKIKTIDSIEDYKLPIKMKPLDSLEVKLEFDTDSLGYFADSVGFGDNCIFEYKLGVMGRLTAAVLSVSDLDFEEGIVGQTFYKQLNISNVGNIDLKITSVVLPKTLDKYFGIDTLIFSPENIQDFNFSDSNPLIVAKDKIAKLRFMFTPASEKVYIDSIVITSNTALIAGTTDSICYLSGIGKIPIDVTKTEKNQIAIYPNPVNDILIIENLPVECDKITIFDESGKTVREINFKNGNGSLKISTKDLSQGLYIFRICNGEKYLDTKFIIMR
jgi:hypothetical protein